MKRPHGTLPFPDAHVLSEQCVRFLAKMRCRDIMVMDVKELANWTDFMVVATGADVEHVWRCSGGLMYQLKRWDPSVKWGETLIDGAPGTEWVNIEFRGKVTDKWMDDWHGRVSRGYHPCARGGSESWNCVGDACRP